MRDAHALLQIVIDSIELHGSVARVTGRVVRAFRGPLRLGTTLTLGLQVHGPGIPAGPPSGTGSTPIESVQPGRVLEAFVDQTPEGLGIAFGLCTLLDAVTETPQLPALLVPADTKRRRSRWLPLLLMAAAVALLVSVLCR